VTWGHTEVFDYLLEKGARIAQGGRPAGPAGMDYDEQGARPLLGWAAANGNSNMFGKLQRKAWEQGLDLDPDEPDGLGNTPFILAAAKGHVHMLPRLYGLHDRKGRSINPHHANHEGNTALLLAAGWGQLASVKWLAQTAGLDINHVNDSGDTALHRAARYGRVEVLSYLLSRRARVDGRNKQGMLYTEVREEYQQLNDGLFEGGEDEAWMNSPLGYIDLQESHLPMGS
jgi:ankyrin repeat protein